MNTTTETLASISKMIASGNRLELPKDEVFANYPNVKKMLINAGGKYKKCGFEFDDDAQGIKDRLTQGDAVNDKKRYQQFFTPDSLAADLYGMCDAESGHTFLEPSAGHAALVKVVEANGHSCIAVELDPANVKWLVERGWNPWAGDFMEVTPDTLGYFDRILANPPFTKNQDVDHVRHMYEFLEPGGVLVSVASRSWLYGGQVKQKLFRRWLKENNAEVTELPQGAFKESGTMIAACTIKVIKQ